MEWSVRLGIMVMMSKGKLVGSYILPNFVKMVESAEKSRRVDLKRGVHIDSRRWYFGE